MHRLPVSSAHSMPGRASNSSRPPPVPGEWEYFIRQGDPRSLNWLNNFMSYHAALGTLEGLYEQFVGVASREKYKLQTVAVGPGGQPIRTN